MSDKLSGITQKSAGTEERNLERDPLFGKAVQITKRRNSISVSLLQKRLGIGYARAVALLDEMEKVGIVGPTVESKPK